MSNEEIDPIIFNNECKFNLFNENRMHFVKRKLGEKLANKKIRPTVKHNGGSVFVWDLNH